jgi:O-antigen/teichoic acid export membrane protein
MDSLTTVPLVQRGRMLSGMRWTVWLTAASIPFSYCTSTLLAKTGPEVLATYGLLSVYIGLVTAFLYLGGDTVVIRYLPSVPETLRSRFVASYFSVVLVALMPWLVLAVLWPEAVGYLFGQHSMTRFNRWILATAPLPIAYAMICAALKATLDIAWAQILARCMTLGSCVIYVLLFIFERPVLVQYPKVIVWGIYLSLSVIFIIIGLIRLIGRKASSLWPLPLRSAFPKGFWKYAWETQQVSIVWFAAQRLDYILLVNLGGLPILGKYVAISVLAGVILIVNSFFIDTLLPSLTNVLAVENYPGAAEILRFYLRLIFLVSGGVTCGLLLLAHPLVAVLGSNYSGVHDLLVVMVLLVGIGSPGAVGGALLSSVGKQQQAVWIGIGQLISYTILLLCLWRPLGLLGAILAYGISVAASNITLFWIGNARFPVQVGWRREYVCLVLIASVSALIGSRLPVGAWPAAPIIWACIMAGFIAISGYSTAELGAFTRCVLPMTGPVGAQEA